MGKPVKRKDGEGETATPTPKSLKKTKSSASDSEIRFAGKPVPDKEAQQRWSRRYQSKRKVKDGASSLDSSERRSEEEEDILQAKCHYTQAVVDECVFNLYDDVYVKAEDGNPHFIAKIVELFEATDRKPYFTAQWFYRAEDTVIKDQAEHVEIDKKRVFYSDVRDDNPLDCIVSKLKIVKVEPDIKLAAKSRKISSCDLYYDMKYSVPYMTFSKIVKDIKITRRGSDTSSSTISIEADYTSAMGENSFANRSFFNRSEKHEMTLLDLYSGCGAMSTGLCFGAHLAGLKLVTSWAVDYNPNACETLKLNHPETEVRNENAEDFLSLLKEWEKLCKKFSVKRLHHSQEVDEDEEEDDDSSKLSKGEFEVGKLLAICYGDPNKVKKSGLYFKVRWKGYDDPDEDTWEPIEGLSNSKERIKEFVKKGYRSKILPSPGDVDFICGGPPCQGISGFNRFRNDSAPLDDPKNHQLKVFMDIVEFLKPKYVLMENVVDILKFAGGLLGRYAIGRLVAMNYQARLGIMAAGSYGLPQFRLRVFLWGALPSEILPQYPLPTHEVIARGGIPSEFGDIYVMYDTKESKKLEKALFLGDAISDLPPVTNDEDKDEKPYGTDGQNEFQKYIRLGKCDLVNCTASIVQNTSLEPMLYDHRPFLLNKDDFERVCQIPKAKGANFRNLPGVLVNCSTNQAELDPSMKRALVTSGKDLVPDYAISFKKGKSQKPFGRLWWDETIATVVTRAEPHNQIILHPSQDRVLSVRENARLQGFPDCYKLCGDVKERYIQVGNAVAVPVALALGYTFGRACQGLSDDQPLTTLPFKFPNCLARQPSLHIEDDS